MQTRDPGRIAPGDKITAQFLNALSEACGMASGAGAAAPLALQSTKAGPVARYAGPIFGAYVGITTSIITARSGSTLGSGTVKLELLNGTTTVTAADIPGPIAVTAFNISSSAGGIASGKYVILMRVAGRWIIITAEC